MGWVEDEPPWFLFFFDPIWAEAGWASWAAAWKPLASSLPPHALAGDHHPNLHHPHNLAGEHHPHPLHHPHHLASDHHRHYPPHPHHHHHHPHPLAGEHHPHSNRYGVNFVLQK